MTNSLSERFVWQWVDGDSNLGSGWQKIGVLALDEGKTQNQVSLGVDGAFQLIKLRSRFADVDIFRWALRFENGVLVDLSVNCLSAGAESRPIAASGRQLKEVVVEYRSCKATWWGRLEIWAHG